jgi:TfoX/Sxy family transcriptional regulator of competence genes
MAFNEKLADRIREKMAVHKKVEEKKMMGGLCFMYKNKMCCGIVKDDLMVRVIENRYEEALSHPYGRQMDFTGRPLKGFVFVESDGFKKEKDLVYWIQMGVEFVDALPPQKMKAKPLKKVKQSDKHKSIRKNSPATHKPKKN